jgi:hypothetical protein
MKNEYKVWRAHGSYFFRSFPKLNVTIVWDDTNKTYEFYSGIIKPAKQGREADIRPNKVVSKDDSNVQNTMTWYAVALIFACGLGLSLAINLIQYFAK